jgi:hypothetical protein
VLRVLRERGLESQLRERDAVEMKKLNTGDVFAKAAIRITNDGSMTDFEAALILTFSTRPRANHSVSKRPI